MVRRASRARLLAAVRAAGDGARAGARRCAARRSSPPRCSRRWPRPPRRRAPRARIAAWLFTAGVLSNVAIGRMPFLLGIAFGVAAWAARPQRPDAVRRRARAVHDARQPGRGRVPDARRRGEADRRRAPRAAQRAVDLPADAERRRPALGAVPRRRQRPLHRHRVLADAGASAPRASRCSLPGAGRCGPAACCIWACWWARSSCRRRSGRTRCGSACSPGRPCSRSRTARRCRSSPSRPSASRCCTCSGCRRCAPWPRRTATRRPGSPSRPRRATSSSAWPSPASASRCR